MQASDLNIKLLTLEAMPYLTHLEREPTADDFDTAIGIGYRSLEAQLPFDEVSDLYCDLDARWSDYVSALREAHAIAIQKMDDERKPGNSLSGKINLWRPYP